MATRHYGTMRNDVMHGTDDADVFVFRTRDFRNGAVDRVLGFDPAEDVIEFRGLGVHYSVGRYFENYADSILDGTRIDAYSDSGAHLTIKLVGVLEWLPDGAIL